MGEYPKEKALAVLENKTLGIFTYFKYDKILPILWPIWLKQEQ